jgi:hypothetical protein
MNRLYIISVVLLAALLWSCEQKVDWSDPTDSVPPGVVSNISVENTNGGARISYTLPADKDLLGVKAVYSLGDKELEMFASAFTDTIVLDGFGDTNEHQIELFVMDKSKNLSAGVPTTIKPLTPPIEIIRETLQAAETFGGVYVNWQNELQKELAVSLFTIDSITGEYKVFETYYSQKKEDKYTFRDFEDVEQNFRIELHDRWNNYALPLDVTLKPLYEEQIKGQDEYGNVFWRQYGVVDNTYKYRGDAGPVTQGTANFNTLFDDIILNTNNWTSISQSLSNYVSGAPSTGMLPIYFPIDMGREASYSRFSIYVRYRNPYSMLLPREFSVWGTNNPKEISEIGDGSQADNLKYWTGWPQVGGTNEWMNDWEKLGDWNTVLPSGWTMNGDPLTADDMTVLQTTGCVYDIDPAMSSKSFRYLRFYIPTITYENQQQLQFSEIKFFGSLR